MDFNNFLNNFCHIFCTDTHLAHLPPRSCLAKELGGHMNKKICQKLTHGTEKKSNKNLCHRTFKTVDDYIKTVTDRNEKSNDCLTQA